MEKKGEKLECALCHKEFSRKYTLQRHQKTSCKGKVEDKLNKNDSQVSLDNLDLVSVMQQQNALISQIIHKFAKESSIIPKKIENNSVTNNTINNITINITDKIDFVQALRDIYGWDEARAINHIKERISQDTNGDIELFCDIYLVGKKENWPFICKDRKTSFFLLKDKGKLINDPGGIELFRNFKQNYTDTLLRLSSRELDKVIDYKVGSPDFEVRRDYLMDYFDLGAVQNKIYDLRTCDRKIFIKKLNERIDNLEKKEDVY